MKHIELGDTIDIIETNVSKCTIYNKYVVKSFITGYPFDSNAFIKEITFLTMLKNIDGFPKIVEFSYEHISNGDDEKLVANIIMTYVGKPLGKYETMEKRLDILHQILQRLRILHKNKIIHCDIKPDNVLINDKGYVSIIDFSHSQILHPMKYTLKEEHLLFQTCCYMSPESYLFTQKTRLVDVWSLGCLYYELITGDYLFPGQTIEDVIQNHQQIDYTKLIQKLHVDEFEKKLMLIMLQWDANKRANVKNLLEMLGHNESPIKLNSSHSGYHHLNLEKTNDFHPIWFNLDSPLLNIGYHIHDYIMKTHPKFRQRQYDVCQVIFAIIHLLYFPSMDGNVDVYTDGFLSYYKRSSKKHKSTDEMFDESNNFLSTFNCIYVYVCHCMSSFLSKN